MYHWSWNEKGWVNKLASLDPMTEAYWEEWDKHIGRSENFGECYRAVLRLSREHFDKPVRMPIAQLLAAMEQGEIDCFEVDELWVRKENKE